MLIEIDIKKIDTGFHATVYKEDEAIATMTSNDYLILTDDLYEEYGFDEDDIVIHHVNFKGIDHNGEWR